MCKLIVFENFYEYRERMRQKQNNNKSLIVLFKAIDFMVSTRFYKNRMNLTF